MNYKSLSIRLKVLFSISVSLSKLSTISTESKSIVHFLGVLFYYSREFTLTTTISGKHLFLNHVYMLQFFPFSLSIFRFGLVTLFNGIAILLEEQYWNYLTLGGLGDSYLSQEYLPESERSSTTSSTIPQSIALTITPRGYPLSIFSLNW